MNEEELNLIEWFMELALELRKAKYKEAIILKIDIEAWSDYCKGGLTPYEAIMEDHSCG